MLTERAPTRAGQRSNSPHQNTRRYHNCWQSPGTRAGGLFVAVDDSNGLGVEGGVRRSDKVTGRTRSVEEHNWTAPPARGGRPATREEGPLSTLTGIYRSGYGSAMDAVLHALADGSRRTILERLRAGPATAGQLAEQLLIAQPGVSRHLRVLREAELVEVRQDAQRRIYSLRPEPLADVEAWLGHYRDLWEQRLGALHTEVSRGKRDQRRTT